MTTTVVNNSLFKSLFEKQKLTGNNFMEWYRNLQIVLSTKDKLPFLEQPIPTLPPVLSEDKANPLDVLTTHQAWVKAQKEIVGLMLMTMDPDIQNNLEHLGAYDMLKELKLGNAGVIFTKDDRRKFVKKFQCTRCSFMIQVCEEVSVYKVRFYDTLSVKESLIFVAGRCITLAFGDRDQGFDPHFLQSRRSFSIFGRTGSSLSTLDSGMNVYVSTSLIHRGRRY
ncbi:hypothetical protein Tco_0054313 [Tanacetum coccineum]